MRLLKRTICNNDFVPFTGPLYDQAGLLRCDENVVMEPEDVISMDWLVDNIVGIIPTPDELIDDARDVVLQHGVALTETK